jgi:HEAT repeat protein
MNDRIIAYMKKNEDVEGLIQLLNTKKSAYRLSVIEVMGDMQDVRLMEALMDTLREDPDEAIRSACAKALGNMKAARCITPLILSLRDKSGVVRSRSAEALGRLKDTKGIKALSTAMTDDNVGVRKLAAISLGLIKDPKAFDILLKALDDPEKVVRAAAAGAIGRLGMQDGVIPLKNLLSESNPKLVRSALEGLGRIGGDNVKEILEEYIANNHPEMLQMIAKDILVRVNKKNIPGEEETIEETPDNGGMSKQDIQKYKEMLKRLNTLGN